MGEHQSPRTPSTIPYLASALVITAALVVCMSYLPEARWVAILGVLGPIIVGLLAMAGVTVGSLHTSAQLGAQGAKIDQIQKQTNGQLRGVIAEVVAAEMDRRGLPPVAVPVSPVAQSAEPVPAAAEAGA